MTLTQLESFLILAQRLNFTQAADDLFISQPALSRMISALEQEVGLQPDSGQLPGRGRRRPAGPAGLPGGRDRGHPPGHL